MAVERVDRVVRSEGCPPSRFDSMPGEAEDLRDRGAQVVVADLAGRDTSEPGEPVDVALEKCLGAAGGEDPSLHYLLRVGILRS